MRIRSRAYRQSGRYHFFLAEFHWADIAKGRIRRNESSGGTLRIGRHPPECGSEKVVSVGVVNDRRTHVLMFTSVIRTGTYCKL